MLKAPRVGDALEVLAKPIAVAAGMDCLDENKQLRPESNCAKRKQAINTFFYNATEKINQLFFKPSTPETIERQTMQTLPQQAQRPPITAQPQLAPNLRTNPKYVLERADNGGWIVTYFRGGQVRGTNVFADAAKLLEALPATIAEPTIQAK